MMGGQNLFAYRTAGREGEQPDHVSGSGVVAHVTDSPVGYYGVGMDVLH